MYDLHAVISQQVREDLLCRAGGGRGGIGGGGGGGDEVAGRGTSADV